MDETELCRMELSGRPGQVTFEGAAEHAGGLLGVDVAAREIDGARFTVVQVLLDDDVVGFDPTLLDGPLVAELHRSGGSGPEGGAGPVGGETLAREPFDHDRFRQRLLRERREGESILRGVLVLTEGELPPPWIRLAFLPVELSDAAGTVLVVRRTSVLELVDGADHALASGAIGEDEHRSMLITIEQRYPDSL